MNSNVPRVQLNRMVHFLRLNGTISTVQPLTESKIDYQNVPQTADEELIVSYGLDSVANNIPLLCADESIESAQKSPLHLVPNIDQFTGQSCNIDSTTVGTAEISCKDQSLGTSSTHEQSEEDCDVMEMREDSVRESIEVSSESMNMSTRSDDTNSGIHKLQESVVNIHGLQINNRYESVEKLDFDKSIDHEEIIGLKPRSEADKSMNVLSIESAEKSPLHLVPNIDQSTGQSGNIDSTTAGTAESSCKDQSLGTSSTHEQLKEDCDVIEMHEDSVRELIEVSSVSTNMSTRSDETNSGIHKLQASVVNIHGLQINNRYETVEKLYFDKSINHEEIIGLEPRSEADECVNVLVAKPGRSLNYTSNYTADVFMVNSTEKDNTSLESLEEANKVDSLSFMLDFVGEWLPRDVQYTVSEQK